MNENNSEYICASSHYNTIKFLMVNIISFFIILIIEKLNLNIREELLYILVLIILCFGINKIKNLNTYACCFITFINFIFIDFIICTPLCYGKYNLLPALLLGMFITFISHIFNKKTKQNYNIFKKILFSTGYFLLLMIINILIGIYIFSTLEEKQIFLGTTTNGIIIELFLYATPMLLIYLIVNHFDSKLFKNK